MAKFFRCILFICLLSLPYEGVHAFSFSNPLIDAADQGKEGVVRRYLQSGRSVDAEGEFGVTALMRASFRGYAPIVSLLLENGANVNATDIGGATALHLAARNGYGRVVELLLENEASIDAQDLEMWTPLMRAVIAGQYRVVEILLDKGADITLVNQLDETVVVHCASVGSERILDALEKKPEFSDISDRQLETARLVSEKSGNVSFTKKIVAILDRRHGRENSDGEEAEMLEGSADQATKSSTIVALEGDTPMAAEAEKKPSQIREVGVPSTVLKPTLEPSDISSLSAAPQQKTPSEVESNLQSTAVKKKVAEGAPLSLRVDTRKSTDVVDLPWKSDEGYASEYDIARSIFDESKTFSSDVFQEKVGLSPLKQMEPKFSSLKEGDFVVQLGTFMLEDEALYKWDNLKRDHSDLLVGFEPLVTPSFIAKERVNLYRLRTGYFATRESASAFCEGLHSREIQCFVVQVGKEPAKEPAKEPVKESVKEPVKEPVKELVKEPVKESVKEEEFAVPIIQSSNEEISLEISSERGEQLSLNYQRKDDIDQGAMPISLDVPSAVEVSEEVPEIKSEDEAKESETVALVVADDLIEGLPWLAGEGVPAPISQEIISPAQQDWSLADTVEEEVPVQPYAAITPSAPEIATPMRPYAEEVPSIPKAIPVQPYAVAPFVPSELTAPMQESVAMPSASLSRKKPIEGVYVPGRGGDYSRVFDPEKRYPVVVSRNTGQHVIYQAPDVSMAPPAVQVPHQHMQNIPSSQKPTLAMRYPYPGHVVYQAPDVSYAISEQKSPVPLQAPNLKAPTPIVPAIKESPVKHNPTPFDLHNARKMASKEIVSEKRDAYFAQHGIKQPPQRYKEYGDFYQELQSKGAVGAGVSEAVPVPDSSYFSEGGGKVLGERTVENWLQIGEFMNEQRANDYWLRMFRFNASLGHLKMVLFKPFSERGPQSASIRVGPLSAGEGFEICEMVKASGKRCTVVSSDGLMSKGARSKEGKGYKEVPKGALQRWINLGAFADRKEAEYYWMFLKDDNQDILSGLKHTFDTTDKLHEFGDNATKLKIGPFTTLPRAQKICKLLMERNVACLVSK